MNYLLKDIFMKLFFKIVLDKFCGNLGVIWEKFQIHYLVITTCLPLDLRICKIKNG